MKVSFQRSAGVGILVAVSVLLCLPSAASAGTILGSAQSFAVLGASGVTNTGSSIISGSLGSFPTASVTGFPTPGTVENGTLHTAADAVVSQAQADELAAYNTLSFQAATSSLLPELGGTSLKPGVFSFTSVAALNGVLTLDFLGQSDARFVFKIPDTLITGSRSSVSVINANPNGTDGIFWLIGTSATLGTTTSFVGNILAHTSISLDDGANIECGRAFAYTGAVTLINNVISNNCSSTVTRGTTTITLPSDSRSEGFSAAASTVVLVSPEPGSFLLLGIGLIGLGKFTARKK